MSKVESDFSTLTTRKSIFFRYQTFPASLIRQQSKQKGTCRCLHSIRNSKRQAEYGANSSRFFCFVCLFGFCLSSQKQTGWGKKRYQGGSQVLKCAATTHKTVMNAVLHGQHSTVCKLHAEFIIT